MALPYQTPANEKSFSGLVDAVIMATGKPGSLVNIVQYANTVVKECQSLGLFAQDMIEDAIDVAVTDNQPIIWNRPPLFRILRTVKYQNCGVYPKLMLPGRLQKDQKYYYYAADNYFVFKGTEGQFVSDQIQYAMYRWQPALGYFNQLGVNSAIFPGGPYATRPAFYDLAAAKWQYLNATNDGYVDTTGDPAVDAQRQAVSMNWLIDQWWELILSGTKSKVFAASGDPRGAAEYSIYNQLKATMKNTVQYEGENF